MTWKREANQTVIHSDIWDTDGDSFFEVSSHGDSCRVDTGSQGLDPGASIEVFQMSGLQCVPTLREGKRDGCFVFDMALKVTHSSDCGSPNRPNCPPPIKPSVA
eukprot:TRINITY_DN1807_c0_g1_i10.p1 TRINITY_DN1807_c0_g1~~TRINITY_DN1807_c0_g1_i10.p1  ORF type:complete len:104 (-),score=19.30 TRINITY_DN1807_c0_g1_i10:308-619(-)